MGLLETAIAGRRKHTSHAIVVDNLGRGIVAGTIPEGSILPGDQELTARYGVSRTVLREAMKTLAAKRLIEPKARVGTRVLGRSHWNFFDPDVLAWRFEAGFDETFIQHLAEMRLAIEPAAAAAAAERASSEEIVELYAIAAKFDDEDHSPETFAKVDLQFHLAVARMSGNPFMRSISSLIEAALAISLRLSSPASSQQALTDAASTHLRIAHAIASRDPAKARTAMEIVIRQGAERIRDTL